MMATISVPTLSWRIWAKAELASNGGARHATRIARSRSGLPEDLAAPPVPRSLDREARAKISQSITLLARFMTWRQAAAVPYAYFDGDTLRTARTRSVAVDQALTIAIEVGSALTVAPRRHRSPRLKPGNSSSRSGREVSGFGLAKDSRFCPNSDLGLPTTPPNSRAGAIAERP